MEHSFFAIVPTSVFSVPLARKTSKMTPAEHIEAWQAVQSAKRQIFGWSCVVTYRPYGSETVVEKEIHRRGRTASCVTSKASRMNGYRSYSNLTSYTRDEWVRTFGVCTETGRYRVG